jgi:hypothetical protein
MPESPRPIDPRGPRFNQGVLTVALVAGFLADARAVVPAFAAVLFLGAAFGPRYGPFLRLYADVIRPRLQPPTELEDPRPPRFAAAVGMAFLGAATAAFAAGRPGLGWGLALVVAALAGLAATSGVCVGCEIYLWAARLAAVRRPAHAWSGGPAWLVFTSPWCASCGPALERLRAGDPTTDVVAVDAFEEHTLAAAYRIKSAPTALLVDDAGEVQVRLVGAAAVSDYLATARSGRTRPGRTRVAAPR